MLGFSRLQRNGLRGSREPAPKMYGWPRGSSCAYEYYQLPLGAHAKVHDGTKEAEVKKEITCDRTKLEFWGGASVEKERCFCLTNGMEGYRSLYNNTRTGIEG